MRPDEMHDRAIELFTKGLHCSQVLTMVGLEKLGGADPAVIKAMGAFGGGIGGVGNICGTLIGAVSVVGCLYSRGSLEEKENTRMWAATKQVMKNFEDLTAPYGGITCRHIAGVDWADRAQVKAFYSSPESRRKHCIRVVGETARALGELLDHEVQARR